MLFINICLLQLLRIVSFTLSWPVFSAIKGSPDHLHRGSQGCTAHNSELFSLFNCHIPLVPLVEIQSPRWALKNLCQPLDYIFTASCGFTQPTKVSSNLYVRFPLYMTYYPMKCSVFFFYIPITWPGTGICRASHYGPSAAVGAMQLFFPIMPQPSDPCPVSSSLQPVTDSLIIKMPSPRFFTPVL